PCESCRFLIVAKRKVISGPPYASASATHRHESRPEANIQRTIENAPSARAWRAGFEPFRVNMFSSFVLIKCASFRSVIVGACSLCLRQHAIHWSDDALQTFCV